MINPDDPIPSARQTPRTNSSAARSTAPRIPSLNGLRGIAASMVVITHAVSALAKPPLVSIALQQSPLALLANGGGGVHVFFVLSGFCLAAPAERAWRAAAAQCTANGGTGPCGECIRPRERGG